MQIEFKELRERIRIIDVLARKGIKLTCRFGSEYASGQCPLPMHPDKRNNSFAVHLPTNRFQCKDTTCQKTNGVGDKWGDCLNLVAAMEEIGFRDAAHQLAEWFPDVKNPASHSSNGSGAVREHQSGSSLANTPVKAQPSGNGNGFMHETGLWLDEVLKPVPEDERPAIKKLVSQRIYQSYINGKSAAKT